MPFDPISPAPLIDRSAEIALVDKMLGVLGNSFNWCQRATCQTDRNTGISSYCLAGALQVAKFGLASCRRPVFESDLIASRMNVMAQTHGFVNFVAFNDDKKRKHADILAFLRELRQSFVEEQNNAV